MARDFGRVHTAFWNDPVIRGLNDRGKLLANYLLTGPHSNTIGGYLLPDAYVADDLGWSLATVREVMGELIKANFCVRCADGRHIIICKFLKWNPIENPNVGKAALRQLDHLPVDPAVEHILNGLEQYEKQFPNGFGTVFERFRNTKPKPNPETNPEPKHDMARSADADETAAAIIAYNRIATELEWPQAVRITRGRISKLKERLREAGGIEGWDAAMVRARASPFLRGDTGRGKGHEKWVPDIDFFLQESTFTKLMEGKYDDRPDAAGSRGKNDNFLAGVLAAVREAGAEGAGQERTDWDDAGPPRIALSPP
jgi:hypothetical protein